MAQDQAIATLSCSLLDHFLPQPIVIVFYVNSEQNMSLFGQILWLGPLSIDISLFLFCVLFHVLIEFELADRENREIIRGKTPAGVEIGFEIEKTLTLLYSLCIVSSARIYMRLNCFF